MKDIDFDELDRAVTSLMGGVKPQSESKSAKTLTISSTLKDDEDPQFEKIKQAAEKIGSEAIYMPTENTEVIQSSPLDGTNTLILSQEPEQPAKQPDMPAATEAPVESMAARPEAAPEQPEEATATPKPQPTGNAPGSLATQRPAGGRFMDVMHPSSDMSTPTTAPAPKRPSRVGATLNVPTPPPRPEAKPTPVAQPAPVVAPETSPVTPAPIPQPPVAEAPAPTAGPVADVSFESSLPVADTQVQLPPAPLVSPFIPDAKVEKRPLNGAAASEFQVQDEEIISTSLSDPAVDTQLAPVPEKEPELPEELHADLLSIEQNFADIMPDEPDEPRDQQSAVEAPAPAPSVLEAPASNFHDDEKAEEVTSDAVAASAATVTPQEESDLSTISSEGTIFDTSEYHKPIEHPEKHGRDWLWIVIIIVIVAVCGAGAAAFYLMGA